MPIRFADYQAVDTQTITFDFGDAGSLEIDFAPNKVSKDLTERAEAAYKAGDQYGMIGCFLDVVTGWDMEDNDGKPWPVARENVAQLGLNTINAVMEAINEAIQADPKGQATITVAKATRPKRNR